MTPYRAAIIGTGNIARSHIRALRSEPERVEVVAAVDVVADNLDNFCETHGIPHRYADAQTMLDEQRPDLVHICTPPWTHMDLCLLALRAGAHVLCEKPLVASLDQMDRVQAVEREVGRTCSSVFQWRFGAGSQHFKRLIDSRALGRPLVGICNTTWYRNHEYYLVPWRGKWDTELGGVSMGHGVHAMDFFLWLMGDWAEVSAMAGTLDRNMEVEDVSMVHVAFNSGALGSIVNSVLSPRQESYLRFDFQRATVELSHLYSYDNSDWRYSIPEGATYTDELAAWQTIEADTPVSHAAQLTALLDALERGQAPLTSGPEARKTIEFLTALYKSALTRQPVAQGSIGPEDPFYFHLYGAHKPARDLRLSAVGAD